MKRNVLTEYIVMLRYDLGIAGVPEKAIHEVEKAISRDTVGGEFCVPFGTQIGNLPVKGTVWFEESPPDDAYRFTHFDLSIPRTLRNPARSGSFAWLPGYAVTLDEAVNLLEGRHVFREPKLDPALQGFWFRLDKPAVWPGFFSYVYVRNGFKVEEADNFFHVDEKSVLLLERGDRVETHVGNRNLFMEADPVRRVVRFTDWKGGAG